MRKLYKVADCQTVYARIYKDAHCDDVVSMQERIYNTIMAHYTVSGSRADHVYCDTALMAHFHRNSVTS